MDDGAPITLSPPHPLTLSPSLPITLSPSHLEDLGERSDTDGPPHSGRGTLDFLRNAGILSSLTDVLEESYQPKITGHSALKVISVVFVSAFAVDESILLSCGPVLKEAHGRYGGKLHMINTPSGAPPSLPRAVLGLDDALVQIAQDQFRFNLQPPAHITASFEEAMLFTRNRVKPILSMLIEAGVAYRWTGVIAELAYPATVQEYKTSLDAVRPVFERLVRLDWTGKDLASFQLRVGYQSDDFFRNYSISGYEERNVPLPRLEAGQSVEISMSEIPLTEAGVQIVLDVNNKPARDKKGAVEDMEPIFQQMTAAYRTLGDDLNLRELI